MQQVLHCLTPIRLQVACNELKTAHPQIILFPLHQFFPELRACVFPNHWSVPNLDFNKKSRQWIYTTTELAFLSSRYRECTHFEMRAVVIDFMNH